MRERIEVPEPTMPEEPDEDNRPTEGVHDDTVSHVRPDPRPIDKVRGGKGKTREQADPTEPDNPPRAASGSETEDFLLKIDWETVPIDHGERVLMRLRDEVTYGARTLQKRVAGTEAAPFCSNPQCARPIRNGAWASRWVYPDKDTGLDHIVTSCSERCHIINQTRLGRAPQVKGGMMVRG